MWVLKAKEKERSSGASQRGKGAAGQYADSSSEWRSKKRGQTKRRQENIQNVKGGIVKHRGRESRYT